MFVFQRAHDRPACRDHHRCMNTTEEHWRDYDHPSCHPFIRASKLEMEDDAPPNKKTKGVHDVEIVDKEPLCVGESVTVTGSRGNAYVIKRHPDKHGKPFYWCECPSRKFHGTKGDNTCKHIEALRGGEDLPITPSRLPTRASLPMTPSKTQFPVALAEKYEPQKHNVVGMVYMEKYDGFYAHYDISTQKMFTRSGNELFIPDWFIDQMPSLSVTGELYGGKGKFSEFSGLFNSNDTSNIRWKDVKFMIFDVVDEPLKSMTFKDRMALVQGVHTSNIETVSIHDCISQQQLDYAFNAVVQCGGEGLMLRKNGAYKAGRSADLLKYKKKDTVDGKVVGYTKGSGRFANFIGSVILETSNGNQFKCVPPDRTNPPSLATYAEIECFEVTSAGVPRHPRWLRIRSDISF